MYNFRYHLISICSIFVALAIGLLLGAALASSDLVKDTSTNMVDSMLERFEELTGTNARLEQLSQDNARLAEVFVEPWASGRLDGRTIVAVLAAEAEDEVLADSLAESVHNAGGAFVRVSVNQQDFGLENETNQEALRRAVPEVEGQAYQQTLAERLAEEWAYSYVLEPSTAPTAEDDVVPAVDYTVITEAGLQSPAPASNSPVPQTPFQASLFEHYTLTRALLSLGIISVECNYAPLLEHENPSITSVQATALRLAQAWKLPYGTNGLLNGLTTKVGSDIRVSQPALSLALAFNERGNAGQLSYPEWLLTRPAEEAAGGVEAATAALAASSEENAIKSSTIDGTVTVGLADIAGSHDRAQAPGLAAGDAVDATTTTDENVTSSATAPPTVNMPNYYVVLTQNSPAAHAIAASAAANGLSCVTSPTGTLGSYALLALLSGAQAGIYGDDRPSENRFPGLPDDASGKAVFIQKP
ncbi:MAG: copper transporter [Coriobacteriales bacterium]|jgi:hypothetical protein|nr:copper transporter [Coriobacteriales bacterium]